MVIDILSETFVYLLEDRENPFIAFDNYKENYSDILYQADINAPLADKTNN